MHKETGEIFAIKVVPTNGDISSLKNEISILKDCKHENIVKFYKSYFKDDHLWLVMEYCAAGSIIDIVRITKRTLGENEIATVLNMSLKGIEYLHDGKKIHRDIKVIFNSYSRQGTFYWMIKVTLNLLISELPPNCNTR